MRVREVIERQIEETKLDIQRASSRSSGKRMDALVGQLQKLERELAEFNDRDRATLNRFLDQENAEASRTEKEVSAFWFRRFCTTLGIANAAAFAALASGLLQADAPEKIAHMVAPAMDRFIWGAIAAGSIPILLWARVLAYDGMRESRDIKQFDIAMFFAANTRRAVALAVSLSAVMFCLGLFSAVGAVHGLAEGKKVADARVAAESKARVHAPSPARE